jgi:hypothetical protein
MIELRSVGNIKKSHNFEADLLSIPFAQWPNPKSEDYNTAKRDLIKKLKYIDGNIELLLGNIKDEKLRWAVNRAFYAGKEIRSLKDLNFLPYLPPGKVQLQIGLIEMLEEIAKSKKPEEKPEHEINSIMMQGEWEANPLIGKVKIDGKDTKMRLHDSLGFYMGHLKACEHEFYKQMAVGKLDFITHEYDMLAMDEKEKKFIDMGDYILNYSNLVGVEDMIYYRRARDFLSECENCWDFLKDSEYSKKYLLRSDDIKEIFKK